VDEKADDITMSNPLIGDSVFIYDETDPFEIRFTGASELILPANCTIVVPREPSGTLQDDIDKIQALNDHDWLFYSFLYPRAALAGDESLLGYEMVFPALRSANNHPFGIAPKNSIPVAGNVLCLIEQDYSPLDDLHPGDLFNNIKNVYSTRYKENITNSSRAKVLLIHFDGTLNLPQDTPPITLGRDVNLVTNDELVPASLRASLSAASSLSATVYAFDLAGHQIDTYSAVASYQENGFEINLPSGNLPDTNSILVQFVDIHGQPLKQDELPLSALEFTKIESIEDGIAPGDTANDVLLYRFQWASGNTERKVGFKAMTDLSDVDEDEDERYRYRMLQVGYWPGFGFNFKLIEPDNPTEFDLAKDWKEPISTLPRFVRFCVFHPGDEFQTRAGGNIDDKGTFETSKFKLATDDNQVQVFNSGDAYFADLAHEIAEPSDTEKVTAIYINNWVSHAHFFMYGNMAGYEINYNDESTDDIAAILAELIAPAQNIVVPMDEHDKAADDRFILMPQIEDQNTVITSDFQVDLAAIVATSPVEQTQNAHRGYVRANSIHAWQLRGENDTPFLHRITASWKNSAGQVPNTTALITPITPSANLVEMPQDLLELTVNEDDPPKAVLRRKLSYDDVLCRLANKDDGCLPQDRFDDTDTDLRILFLDLVSGRVEYIPLNPDSSTAGNNDVVLHTFDSLIATDSMAVAIVIRKQNPAEQNYTDDLKTRFRLIEYSNEAFINGNVPLLTTEWAGLLRQQIAEGVTVKALYWENYLASLAPDSDLERGLNNNAELTAILNRTVAGKRGFAMRDRATRPLGAFHQKSIVVVKEVNDPFALDKQTKVVAYVGGMDVARSRWDREAHYHLDPERMEGKGWHDVHMRIEGSAGLDVLLNFKQRWEALNIFETQGLEDCRPLNVVPESELSKSIKVPKPEGLIKHDNPGHFLQITRTIAPDSCYTQVFGDKRFVDENGELGSLFSYIKAIENARKYILINDQYLFSVEITNAIHEALLKKDGPEFAIICLPKKLNESDIVDPLIYKVRKRALNALFYGATPIDASAPMETAPQRYNVNSPQQGTSVKDRVVVVSPINRDGDDIYVHSKQFIVDDCIMSIGSANFSIRGSTYEMEINATAVGRKLVKGGTDLVREQRIELCRRLLGLPKAYSTLLQDHYATFKIFKAIETQSDGDVAPTLNLHPLKPMIKKLDPEYVTKTGGAHAGFDEGVDFVVATDENSPGFKFIAQNIIDADGRQPDDDATAVIATSFITSAFFLGEFPRNPVAAYGRISFDLTNADTAIRQAIDDGKSVALDVTLLPEVDNGSTATPLKIASFAITIDPITSLLVIKGLHDNELLINISTSHIVIVQAQLTDENEVALGFSGMHEFNPLTQPILPASYTSADLLLS
jgi:phosphatidylserine/phosphatidylglycerophosphate/cardiolipin synthase-like enzyme